MRKWLNQISFLGIIGYLAFAGLSCNDAADGFNAEAGSTVKVPADTTITTSGGVLFLYSAFVVRKDGSPGNNIQIRFFANNGCRLYDKAANEAVIIPDLARLQEVDSASYFVTTDTDGKYQIVVRIDPPSTFGLTKYTCQVFVDIGVASGTTTFSVAEPS